jgi:hypothetical protein
MNKQSLKNASCFCEMNDSVICFENLCVKIFCLLNEMMNILNKISNKKVVEINICLKISLYFCIIKWQDAKNVVLDVEKKFFKPLIRL